MSIKAFAIVAAVLAALAVAVVVVHHHGIHSWLHSLAAGVHGR